MNIKKKIVFVLILCFAISSAFSFQFSPMSATYDSSGAGSAKVYTVTNDSNSPIAVQVKALTRSIGIDGEEITEDASSYFSIQPSKMIVKPQSTQLVRVQYRGPRLVAKEASYRIEAEQIPYSTGASNNESGQMINFLFVYSTTAYVAPPKVVEGISSSASINAEGKLEILITNTGSVHQMLNSLAITVHGEDGSSYALTKEDMGNVSGANLLAGAKLRVVIDVPEALAGSDAFKADVAYDYKYSV